MNQTSINLQDTFLKTANQEKSCVTVFLTNGFQFKGFVKAFDNFTIVMEVDSKNQLIYKHAISTIIPSTNLKIF